MDHSRLGTGRLIAGAAGAALLIIMFAFGWFGLPDTITGPGGVVLDVDELAASTDQDTTANAFQAFGFIDLILLLTVIVAVGVAIASAMGVAVPAAASALIAGLGVLSAVLVLFRIISPPDGGAPSGIDFDIGREIGVYLGFLAAAAIAYGGWRSMQDDGASFSAQAGGSGVGTPRNDPPPPPAQGPAA